jgi:hypothetical protein
MFGDEMKQFVGFQCREDFSGGTKETQNEP